MTSITHKILKKNYIKILQDSNIWRYGQKKGAPFVCIEPWQNTADRIDSIQIYKDKENIIELPKDKKFECKYSIKF